MVCFSLREEQVSLQVQVEKVMNLITIYYEKQYTL